MKPGYPNIARRAVLVAAVGWLPLAILSAIYDDGWRSFAADFGAHSRFLVAAPLFILAESVCAPRLGVIARYFLSDLVQEPDRERLESEIARTRGLLNSPAAEAVAILLAYALTFGLAFSAASTLVPQWHTVNGDVGAGYSFAGWWHVLVSLPLLLLLFLGWMWRLGLWAWLLWKISRLNLRLIPVHPDRAAGLLFVGSSARAFASIALALGAINAGRTANSITEIGAVTDGDTIRLLAMIVGVLVLFVGPITVFSDKLMRVRRQGVFRYGALARVLGEQLERKWFESGRPVDAEALTIQDFSATADLFQVTSNAYRIRFIPVDRITVLILAAAVSLPLLPVLLLVFPMPVILANLKQLLF